MPRVTLQVHPLAHANVLHHGVDCTRGTGRTTAIILDGIVRLQREGYTSDNSVYIKDHFEGTQAHLNNFAQYTRDILKGLGMHTKIRVVQHNRDVELRWVLDDKTN